MIKRDIYAQAKAYTARNMNLRLYDIALVRGDRQYLFDDHGARYLDMFSGASAAILGYANAELIAAYTDTCSRLHHTCTSYMPTEESVALAQALVERVPTTDENKVIFGLSGSDAMECAIKAARRYTGRRQIVCFDRAYHGSCGLSVAATRWDSLRTGLILDEEFQAYSYPHDPDEGARVMDAITAAGRTETPAAVVIESIQGDGGMYPVNVDFLRALEAYCRRHDIVLILDEIQSGMARTGRWWGYEHTEVLPDIVAIGKPVTSGYAVLSAVVGRAAVLDALDKGQHVFTYAASPPACAVCAKVIEIIERDGHVQRNTSGGDHFMERLRDIDSPLVAGVRGRGLMIGVEIGEAADCDAGLVGLRCAEKGVYFGYYGLRNEILRVHPPYLIDQADMDLACDVLADTLREIERGELPPETVATYQRVCIGLGESAPDASRSSRPPASERATRSPGPGSP